MEPEHGEAESGGAEEREVSAGGGNPSSPASMAEAESRGVGRWEKRDEEKRQGCWTCGTLSLLWARGFFC